jgi:hypothetical protein
MNPTKSTLVIALACIVALAGVCSAQGMIIVNYSIVKTTTSTTLISHIIVPFFSTTTTTLKTDIVAPRLSTTTTTQKTGIIIPIRSTTTTTQKEHIIVPIFSTTTTTIKKILIPPTTIYPTIVNTGILAVETTPTGATVAVDGVTGGTTPYKMGDLSIGSHTVVISHPCCRDYKTNANILAGRTTKIFTILEPKPMGDLYVISNPLSAQVWIDGFFWGVSPLLKSNLSEGIHSLSVSKPGYTGYRADVFIKDKETTTVNAILASIISVSTTTYTIPKPGGWCQGADVNQDGVVDYKDINALNVFLSRSDCNKLNMWCNWADVNEDGIVDEKDEAILAANYKRDDCTPVTTTTLKEQPSTTTTQPKGWWCNGADIDKNGKVDNTDLAVVVDNWNKDTCIKLNDWCDGADINRDGKVDKYEIVLVNVNMDKADCSPNIKPTTSTTVVTTTTSTSTTQEVPTTTTIEDTTTVDTTETTTTIQNRPDYWCEYADANKDGEVDEEDLSILKEMWGKTKCSSQDNWCEGADSDKDGRVDERDSSRMNSNFGRQDCNGPRKATTTTSTTTTIPAMTCQDGKLNQGEEGIDCGGPCKKCQKPKANLTLIGPYVIGKSQTFALFTNFTSDRSGTYRIKVDLPSDLRTAGDVEEEVSTFSGDRVETRFNAFTDGETRYGDYTVKAKVVDSRGETVAEALSTMTVEDPLVLETPILTVQLPTIAEAKKRVSDVKDSVFNVVTNTTNIIYSNKWLMATLVLALLGAGYIYLSRIRAAPPAEPAS